MKKVELVIVCIVLFVVTGCVAYVIETIWYRSKGKMGRNESLAEHYKKIDQKQGNVAAALWAVIWVILMILSALIIYLVS